MTQQYKDALLELIESGGGLSADNLLQIADCVRDFKQDFSVQYLSRLLQGHPPTNKDSWAISQALEPECDRWLSGHWRLEDGRSRGLAKYGFRQTGSQAEAKRFVDFAYNVNFRNGEVSDSAIPGLFKEFLDNHPSRLEDEMELFSLPKDNDLE